MQAWPRRRGRVKNATTKAQNEKFAQANKLAKYASADDQWMVTEIARNSPLYPRDLLVSAMYGRLFETLTIDGKEYVSVAVRDDISDDLDKVGGTEVGTILVRHPEGWRGLVPGNAGEVLTSEGAGDLPAWAPGSGGSGAYYTGNLPSTVISGTLFATKGNAYQMARACTVHEMAMLLNPVTAHTYEGRIWELSTGNRIQNLLATTGPITGLAVGRRYINASLTAPLNLAAGLRYFIAWSRTDGPNNFILPIHGAVTPRFLEGFPSDHLAITGNVNNWVQIALANPPFNTLLTIGNSGQWVIPLVLSL